MLFITVALIIYYQSVSVNVFLPLFRFFIVKVLKFDIMVTSNNFIGKGVIFMDFSIFAERLNTLIENNGLTAAALSEQTGVTAPAISRYLKGDRQPKLQYVLIFSRFFNVSVDWLLGIESDRYAGLPQDIKELVELYSIARPEDRKVIQVVLERYKNKEKRDGPYVVQWR